MKWNLKFGPRKKEELSQLCKRRKGQIYEDIAYKNEDIFNKQLGYFYFLGDVRREVIYQNEKFNLSG